MALKKDFQFPGPASLRAEAERRAVVMFGEDWRDGCSPNQATISSQSIARGELRLSFNKDGLWSSKADETSDLPDGSPAILRYFPDGTLQRAWRFRDDKLNDSSDGLPAKVEYFPDGSLKRKCHHRAGHAHDPDSSTVADIHWYPSGVIRTTAHYCDGFYCDPADGSPARVDYDETGEIAAGSSPKNGRLSASATIELLRLAQMRRVAAVLGNVDQAVVPSGMPLPETNGQPSAAHSTISGRQPRAFDV